MSQDKKLPDLLPWDFAPDYVLTPERILKHQAELIGQKSGARLTAEVEHSEDDKLTEFGFVVNAPVLNYAVRLFRCWHKKGLPYPTTVEFREFTGGTKSADSEKEFRELIQNAFES